MKNQKKNVLLAEDSIANQQVTLMLLESIGYQADIVDNGRDAVQALLMKKYDIVLMDIQMPELNGVEATSRIRSEFSQEKQPRIIALTASLDFQDEEHCRQLGMDGVLSKPVRLKHLETAMQEASEAGAR